MRESPTAEVPFPSPRWTAKRFGLVAASAAMGGTLAGSLVAKASIPILSLVDATLTGAMIGLPIGIVLGVPLFYAFFRRRSILHVTLGGVLATAVPGCVAGYFLGPFGGMGVGILGFLLAAVVLGGGVFLDEPEVE